MLALVAGILLAVAAIWSATQASAGGTQHDKRWVCKYVGTPGQDEVLKSGKNPTTVSSSATVGTYFNDAQGRSYVLDVQTDENTGDGNSYTGEKSCPVPDNKPIPPQPPTQEKWTCDGYFTGGYTFDRSTWTWVAGDLVKQRNLTADEVKNIDGQCGLPPTQEKWTCDGYFTGGWDWVDGAWVAGDLLKQRDLTPEERTKLDCDVVSTPPPSTTPPASTPPAEKPATVKLDHKTAAAKVAAPALSTPAVVPAAKSGSLASTGNSEVPIMLLIGGLAILAGTGFILYGRRLTRH